MAILCVNIDHVATVRQARGGTEPSVEDAAIAAEKAGAQGITVHLREDRRHIQDKDVSRLKESIKTKFNLEMSISEDEAYKLLNKKSMDKRISMKDVADAILISDELRRGGLT